MKGTAIIELIIVMVFLMAGVPFLIMLVSYNSKYSYLEDKSMSTYTVEHESSESIVDATSLRLNAAQVIFLPIVNDNHCPYPGKVVFLETQQYTNGKINDTPLFNAGERASLDTNLHYNIASVTSYRREVNMKTSNYRQSARQEFNKWNSRAGTTESVFKYVDNNTGSTVVPFLPKAGITANQQAVQASEDAHTNQLVYRMYFYQTTDSTSNVQQLPSGKIKVNRTWVITSYYPNTTY